MSVPNDWKVVYAEDIAAEGKAIVSGPFGSNIGKRFFVESGVPVIRGSNLTLGVKRFVEDAFVYLTEEKAAEFKNCEAIAGDLVFTAAGTLGQVGLIQKGSKYPRYIISNKQLRIRPNTHVAYPLYLYYWFASPEIRNHITGLNTGSSVPLISLGKLRSIPINLPPLPTQRKIAAILSAYDDLIENNSRRIAILQETAQATYREWFVHFRFPGHENVKLVDSPLGQIPEGWEVVRVKSLLKRLKASRQYKQTDVTNEGTVPVIDQSTAELLGFHNNEPDFEASSDTPVVIFGDHTCKMELMTTPFSIGPNVVPFVSKTEHPVGFVFYVVKSLVSTQEYKRHWTTLNNKDICLGPAAVAYEFVDVISPMVEAVALHRNKNRYLRNARDLLLPKLISGKLDVEDLVLDVGLTTEALEEATA